MKDNIEAAKIHVCTTDVVNKRLLWCNLSLSHCPQPLRTHQPSCSQCYCMVSLSMLSVLQLTSMMQAPAGPTVLTMWTLGVEVERCLCRDWPSPPGIGKRKAEVGDSRPILIVNQQRINHNLHFRVNFRCLMPCFQLHMDHISYIWELTQQALGLRLCRSAIWNYLAIVWISEGTHLGRDWDHTWTVHNRYDNMWKQWTHKDIIWAMMKEGTDIGHIHLRAHGCVALNKLADCAHFILR